MIVYVVLAIVAGTLFIGQLDGRIKALENDKDFSSIKEQRIEVLAVIDEAKKSALEEFSATDKRIITLEDKWLVERKPGAAITLSHGASGTWGNWTGAMFCPEKQYVCGLEQRTEPKQSNDDDTGMTGVRFHCCPL